jgi:Sulfotransferase family
MSHAMTLDPKELMALAQAEAGLQDFGEPSITEPLTRLTAALAAEANLNGTGVYLWHTRLLGILITRLRACDWFKRHPEILEERLPPTLVIVGLSRTGTTLLHRLIAADERFYSAAWWECRFPVPGADDLSGAARIAAAKLEVEAILQAAPALASIHPWDAMGADEDIMLLDQTLLTTTSESLACVPSYREWVHAQDLRPAYVYLVKLMKFLQWQKRKRGQNAERWVLKTPMHLGYVEVLNDLLPEVTFVQTHRDPVTSIPSYASMVKGMWALGSDTADAKEAARQWCATLEEHLNHCLEMRKGWAPAKFVDTDFRDTVSKPLSVVERIFERIGLPMTPKARAAIEAYMASHPREGRPKHEYTLEEAGFTQAELEQRFKKYREKHILTAQK